MNDNEPAPAPHGRVLLLTGDGKGKTTAALGLALRALGHGLRVCIIQFVKARKDTGEVKIAARLEPDFEIIPMGRGFVREHGGTPEDRAAAKEALDLARRKMTACDVLVLDEINPAVTLGLVKVEDVLELLAARPPALHVLLTGRGAHPSLRDAADTVTDFVNVKHPYEEGFEAVRGIEY